MNRGVAGPESSVSADSLGRSPTSLGCLSCPMRVLFFALRISHTGLGIKMRTQRCECLGFTWCRTNKDWFLTVALILSILLTTPVKGNEAEFSGQAKLVPVEMEFLHLILSTPLSRDLVLLDPVLFSVGGITYLELSECETFA